MKNINIKKAAIGAALLYVGFKSMTKNKTADTAVIALGAVTLAKSIPLISANVA